MSDFTVDDPGRRWFLRAAPVAAAAGLALADVSLLAASAAAQSSAPTFQVFTAEKLRDDIKTLDASPGNDNLVDDKTFVIVLTTEKTKSAPEFEWHEGRDHIFQILDGSTLYELGGTPKNGRNIRPGEWLAPDSEGATSVTLHKGDMLVVPRGTPHRRKTAGSVTFTLISPQGKVTA
jgi:mannose-6-phosphate isomerase-like protein (cupin superfamily)